MKNQKKHKYVAPHMESITLDAGDIITTSGAGGFLGDEDVVVKSTDDIVF